MIRPVMVSGVWALKFSLHTAASLPPPVDIRVALCSSHQDAGELWLWLLDKVHTS